MRVSRMLALLGIVALGLYAFRGEVIAEPMETEPEAIEAYKEQQTPVTEYAPASEKISEEEPEPIPFMAEEIQETTIEGGLSIKNDTPYQPDISQLLKNGPGLRLSPDAPQILIIHTHGSEAYTQAGLDRYESSDNNRTEDTEFNIVRVGDELTALLTEAGLNVIHDREIYDYPSYTGSYTRSGEAAARHLLENPSIGLVIDMHRDALGANGVVYKTMAEEEGVCASQIMLLVGTDASGLEHPNWSANLSLALYLQEAVTMRHPTLMRPVSLVQERYNQHLSRGAMIMEVGSSGNTLQEALAAIRLFADAAAPALLALVEHG